MLGARWACGETDQRGRPPLRSHPLRVGAGTDDLQLARALKKTVHNLRGLFLRELPYEGAMNKSPDSIHIDARYRCTVSVRYGACCGQLVFHVDVPDLAGLKTLTRGSARSRSSRYIAPKIQSTVTEQYTDCPDAELLAYACKIHTVHCKRVCHTSGFEVIFHGGHLIPASSLGHGIAPSLWISSNEQAT
jgi:hypothetical protein